MANPIPDPDPADKNSIWKLIGSVVLVFLAFGILIAIINPNDSGSTDEGEGTTDEQVDPETERQVYIITEFADYVEPLLSEEGKDNLKIITDYVEEDPAVLKLDYDEHPEEVREAYEDLKSELNYTFGSGERPDIYVEEGAEYQVEGILEETDEESPMGPVYKVVDQNTNADLYFIFDTATVSNIESEALVGESVEITIKITGVDGTNVTYEVLSGPTLIDSSTDE